MTEDNINEMELEAELWAFQVEEKFIAEWEGGAPLQLVVLEG